MTEEKTTDTEVEKTEITTEPEVEKTEVKSVPYTRFKEVNDGLVAANKAIEKMQLTQKKAKEDQLAEDGKFKELNETLTKERDEFKTQADEWTAYQDDRRKALIEKIPEEDRDIYEGLALDKLEKVVNKFESKTNINVGTPGGVGKYNTQVSVAEAFNRGEITIEQYKEESKKFKGKGDNIYNR